MTHARIHNNAEKCHFCWSSFHIGNGSTVGKPLKKRFPKKFYKSCTRHLTDIFGEDDSMLDDFEEGGDSALKSVMICTICFKYAKKLSEMNGQLEKLENEISKFVDSTVEYVLNLRNAKRKLEVTKDVNKSPIEGAEIITTESNMGRPEEIIIHIKSENFAGFDFEPEDVTDFFSVNDYTENANSNYHDFVEIIEDAEIYDGNDEILENPLEIVLTEENPADIMATESDIGSGENIPCSSSSTSMMQTINSTIDNENIQPNSEEIANTINSSMSPVNKSNPEADNDRGISRTSCEPSRTLKNPQQWFNCVLCGQEENQKRFPTLESLHLHIDIYHKVPHRETRSEPLISDSLASAQPFGMGPPNNANVSNPKCRLCGKLYSSPQDHFAHQKICHLRQTPQHPTTNNVFPQQYPVPQSHMLQQTPTNQSHIPQQQMYSNQIRISHPTSSNHSHNDLLCKLCPPGPPQTSYNAAASQCNSMNCNMCPATPCNQIGPEKNIHMTNSQRCPYCPAVFTLPDQLNFHIRTHSETRNPNARSFVGALQQMSGRYADNMLPTNRPGYNWTNYNNNNPTNVNFNREFRCTICQQTFSQMSELYNHSFLHQPVNTPRNNPSNPTFPYSNNPVTSTGINIVNNKPLETSGNVKKYSCSDCPASFDDWTTFANHCYTHDNYGGDKSSSVSPTRGPFKPFKCLICGVSFDAISQLTQHSFIHPSVVIGKAAYRSYVCEICGANFTTIGDQVSHKAIHSVNNVNDSKVPISFKCEKCPESFKTKFDLISHQYVHYNHRSPTYRSPTEPNHFQPSTGPNHPFSPPATPNHPFSPPATPNHPFSPPATPNHPFSPPATPNHPFSPPAAPNHIYSPPAPPNQHFSPSAQNQHFSSPAPNQHFSSPAPNQHFSPAAPNQHFSPAAPNQHFSPAAAPNHHFSSPPPNQSYSSSHVTCPICGVIFAKLAELQEHSKIHTNEPRYQFYHCSVCKQPFKTEQELSRHQLVHHAWNAFQASS